MSSTSDYFRQREEELLKLNAKLEEQKFRILQTTEENIRPASPAVLPAAVSTAAPNAAELEALQATIRYQKARIAALQEELERVNKLGAEKDAEIASFRLVVKETSEETKKLSRRITVLEQENERLAKKAQSAEGRAKLAEEEVADMKKEKDVNENSIKKLESQLRTSEVKIARVAEENERLRVSIKEIRNNERDKMAVDKDEVGRLRQDVARLTKQRAELINAFKKQAKLVDVLRRQKAHIEASRLLNFTEEEFTRIINAPPLQTKDN